MTNTINTRLHGIALQRARDPRMPPQQSVPHCGLIRSYPRHKPPGADKPKEEKVDKEVEKQIGRSYGSKAGAEAKQDSGAAGRGAALAGALLGFVVVLL